jgi:hypothetical protein
MRVAFDTHVVSYFLTANQGHYVPSTDPALAAQEVAAFCLWMYVGQPIVVPTVFGECDAIPNPTANREHRIWNAYHFDEICPSGLDPRRVDGRASELSAHHKGPKRANDCRIVAECEEPDARIDALATFDTKLVKNLKERSTILIASPLECLLRSGISADSPARFGLHAEHPLAPSTWWRIENALPLCASLTALV